MLEGPQTLSKFSCACQNRRKRYKPNGQMYSLIPNHDSQSEFRLTRPMILGLMMLATVFAASGCGTMANMRGKKAPMLSHVGVEEPRPFGGVGRDIRWVASLKFPYNLMYVADIPLSFIGDVVTLPRSLRRKPEGSESLAAFAGEFRFSGGLYGETLSINPRGTFKSTCWNDCNGRIEAHGRANVANGDEEKDVSGLPAVPDEWTALLLPRPLNGKVIEAVHPRRAKVDLGVRDGAWSGMALWVNCEGATIATVVEVHADHCFIESNHPATVYRVGQAVSSKNRHSSTPK
jgi:hypothetical protein